MDVQRRWRQGGCAATMVTRSWLHWGTWRGGGRGAGGCGGGESRGAPQAGGIATFAGTTCDTFEGKSVVELMYEAYVPMAIRCIKSICSSARSSWNPHSIAVTHRLGSVLVTVPIWKKEVYANGEVWKENSEFAERRLELGKDGICSGRKVEVKAGDRKTCCGSKVKVDDEAAMADL
ncbi:hypothetical protein EZV62_001959 [Acer yangbiense]|uniref:Uncharacterized protein n=1 Tax=Acer yangbiense TaxID=1000413 RepID=A0A5C7IVQ7_9ROSI|nr:hypothetical protein EZV62_001959 [Acer yangbiense]